MVCFPKVYVLDPIGIWDLAFGGTRGPRLRVEVAWPRPGLGGPNDGVLGCTWLMDHFGLVVFSKIEKKIIKLTF